MIKLQSNSEFQQPLPLFSIEDNFKVIYNQFLSSSLGKIYQAISWNDLVESFSLKENKKGPDCIFSPQGKLALMFLKNYACCSDERLIEQFNSNIHYQLFCGLILGVGEQIKNFKIVSQIRCELAGNLNIDDAQSRLIKNWLPYMEELEQIVTDAKCYESSLRYPTDQKLLWEATDWCHKQLKLLCKYGILSMPRSKYNKWAQRYWNYSHKRRKPVKERVAITRGLLGLVDKLLGELVIAIDQLNIQMPSKYYKQYAIIENVLKQQSEKFHTGKQPENLIVSLSKIISVRLLEEKKSKPLNLEQKLIKYRSMALVLSNI